MGTVHRVPGMSLPWPVELLRWGTSPAGGGMGWFARISFCCCFQKGSSPSQLLRPLIHFLSHQQPPPSCFSSDLDVHPEFTLSGPSPSVNYIFPQWMPTKVLSGLQHMGCKDRLRKLDLLSLENERGGVISVSLRSGCEGGHFPQAHRERTR